VRRLGVAAGLVALSPWAAAAAHAQVSPPAPEAIAVGDYLIVPVVETRVRGEYWHDLDGQDQGVLLERTRLGADVQRGPVEGRVVFQDARLWDLGQDSEVVSAAVLGQPPQLAATTAYEAWVEAHTAGARPSYVRVGRQPVEWGEGRLLGVADWSPTGRSLDAVRGRLVVGDAAFELLAASLSDSLTTSLLSPAYGQLLGARAEWALDPLFAVEVYGLIRLAQFNPIVSLENSVKGQTYTPALRLHGVGQGWTWGVEGAYQLGHADDLGASGMDRGAWAATGHLAYAFEHVQLNPAVRVEVAYASGDDGGSTYRAFDPLLPDVHTSFTGAMDLFAWSNEEEADARVTIEPWSDAVASLAYRYTQLAEPGGSWRSAYLETIAPAFPTNTARSLGHEGDLALVWSPWVPVDLTLGYSALVLGDGAKRLLAAHGEGTVNSNGTVSEPNVAQFAYAQVSLRVP
jgi:hypothetical protein